MKLHCSKKKHIGNQCHCRPGSSSATVDSGVRMNESSTHESNEDGPHSNPYSKSPFYSLPLLHVHCKYVKLFLTLVRLSHLHILLMFTVISL